MRIGVIGAGWLGGTVGGAWAKAGHEVLFSSRHPDKLAAMVRELGPHASAGTPAEAAAFGEVVLIATPYGELETIGRDLGDALKGKIVLDACNPYPPDPEAFRREIETAGVAVSTAKYSAGRAVGSRLQRRRRDFGRSVGRRPRRQARRSARQRR